jgi:hypothetical protein
MPSVHIECPSCRWEGKVDEAVLGRQLKCKKCGSSFLAEIGGSYDVDLPQSEAVEPPPSRAPRRPGAARRKRIGSAKPIDAEHEKLLDRWADE